jgi:hypothetical protein
MVSHHTHDFEKNAWPLFLDGVTPTSQWHGATSRVGHKLVKELQSLASFLHTHLSLLKVRTSPRSAMILTGKLDCIAAHGGYPD